MRILDVIRRPKKCPYCGGDICDIIYGYPVSTWEEDHLRATGHKAVLGGCCFKVGVNPEYQCDDCGMQFNRLSFPPNAKELARNAILKDNAEIFCDVEYKGLYRKQEIFSPIVKEGVCWDDMALVFVNQLGKVKVRYGIDLFQILDKMREAKERVEHHNEKFYWIAAKREIKDDEYYSTVHKCGIYHGMRAYKPIFKEEYILEPVCIGFPLVILVDSNGKATSIRDFISLDIYDELRKKRKK